MRYFMKVGNNGDPVPDFSNCTTVQQVEDEFQAWAYKMCIAQFCLDKGLSVNRAARTAYEEEWNKRPKLFYSVADENELRYYYIGTNTVLKDKIKEYGRERDTAKRKIRAKSNAEGIAKVEQGITGTKIYTKEEQEDFNTLAADIKNGKITAEEKAERIQALNKKYNINLSTNASYKDIINAGQKTKGGIVNDINTGWKNTQTAIGKAGEEIGGWFDHEIDPETGEKKPSKIETAVSEANQKIFGDSSKIWDESNNETITKFKQKGITGDVMWGVLTGKYNTDDQCRKDLEKLAEDVNNGVLTPEEKKARVAAINQKYNLNLSDDITAEDITAVVKSKQEYEYKKTVRRVAERIMQDKINENINTKLEERLGHQLSKAGIKFSFKDRDTVQDLKDIIRGVKTVTFNKDKFLKGMQDQLEKKIAYEIETKVNAKIDEMSDKVNSKIDKVGDQIIDSIKDSGVYRRVDQWNTQLTNWTNNPDSFKLLIANKLDSAIQNPVGGIANALDKMDPLNKLGLGSLGLGSMFTGIVGEYTAGYAARINAVVQPVLAKALEVTTQVRAAMQKAIDFINDLRNKAKALVEKWKNAVKDAIAKAAKKLVNEIIKYVKINISGMPSSFKI